MIDEKNHPVAWALLLMDLDEVQGHLRSLVSDMAAKGQIEEEELRITLGHIYAHLNRTWNRRNSAEEISEKEWDLFSQFPKDLDPVG